MRWQPCVLCATLLIGCVSSPGQESMGSKQEPAYVRHMATKNDILYTYRITGDGPTGFELAEADANKICRSKWGLAAVQKTQQTCGVYNTSAMHCSVAFQCM